MLSQLSYAPIYIGGGEWIRTIEDVRQQIYSLPPLAARELLHILLLLTVELKLLSADYKLIVLPNELSAAISSTFSRRQGIVYNLIYLFSTRFIDHYSKLYL